MIIDKNSSGKTTILSEYATGGITKMICSYDGLNLADYTPGRSKGPFPSPQIADLVENLKLADPKKDSYFSNKCEGKDLSPEDVNANTVFPPSSNEDQNTEPTVIKDAQ